MSTQYVTLMGEKIDISGLTEEEKYFLGMMVKAFNTGESYPNFVNRIHIPGSPTLCGQAWVDDKVVSSSLYQVCQDLADRLGIAQGFLAQGENTSAEGAGFVKRADPEYLSAKQAGELIGVTAEAVRKAIREARLPAERVGKTYLVQRQAILAFSAARSRPKRSIGIRVLASNENK